MAGLLEPVSSLYIVARHLRLGSVSSSPPVQEPVVGCWTQRSTHLPVLGSYSFGGRLARLGWPCGGDEGGEGGSGTGASGTTLLGRGSAMGVRPEGVSAVGVGGGKRLSALSLQGSGASWPSSSATVPLGGGSAITSYKNSGDTSPSWGVINVSIISHTAAPLPPYQSWNVENLNSQH